MNYESLRVQTTTASAKLHIQESWSPESCVIITYVCNTLQALSSFLQKSHYVLELAHLAIVFLVSRKDGTKLFRCNFQSKSSHACESAAGRHWIAGIPPFCCHACACACVCACDAPCACKSSAGRHWIPPYCRPRPITGSTHLPIRRHCSMASSLNRALPPSPKLGPEPIIRTKKTLLHPSSSAQSNFTAQIILFSRRKLFHNSFWLLPPPCLQHPQFQFKDLSHSPAVLGKFGPGQ